MNRDLGVLMHISSLPSKYGIGTLGKEAYDFVDFLKKSNCNLWQILPLNVTSYGDSPYQSPSNNGLNYYFIDFDILFKKGLLKKEEYENIKWSNSSIRIDYSLLFNNKLKVLKIAFSRFNKLDSNFINFINSNNKYSDFAFFMVLKDLNNLSSWNSWKEEYRNYSKTLEDKIIKEHYNDYLFYLWTQYEFLDEYLSLKKYANSNGIKIMGDLPIYVAFDSVEVYKYPYLFELDEKHNPINVAGCPPDCFSENGQLWGNPLYNWKYHKETNYKWWNERILNSLSLFDYLRIDHFRGFSAYYSIPFKDKTAKNGKWVKGPGFDLFKDKLDLPIVAEDLGLLDEDFYTMMKKTKYPGMKIVTQCFDSLDKNNEWRPSNYTYNFFSYTATHDSQTTKQFINELSDSKKELMLKILKEECDLFNIPLKESLTNEEITLKICELNVASNSKCAIIPLQDLFVIGKEGRMNFPSTLSSLNWSWRISKDEFNLNKDKISSLLNEWSKKYNRN